MNEAQRIDTEVLIARVEEIVGLNDWDGSSFRAHLRFLEDCIAESDPTPEAMSRLEDQWRLVLANRLRLVDERRRLPDVAKEVIYSPLMILGLPRTGTTFLSGLFASDPGNRCNSPLEVNPFPDPSLPPPISDLGHNPENLKRHIMGTPPEDIGLLGYEFLSIAPTSYYLIPQFAWYVLNSDATTAYDWHRRALQHGQTLDRRERWAIHSNAHSYHPVELFATYPDLRAVVTHRDPVKVFASSASLVTNFRKANYARVLDPVAGGKENTELRIEALRRLLEFRDNHKRPEQFFDVTFQAVENDPMQVARDVYDHFDLPLTQAAEEAMSAYVNENRHDKYREQHGTHEYRAVDYGIDEAALYKHYADYFERFGVEPGL